MGLLEAMLLCNCNCLIDCRRGLFANGLKIIRIPRYFLVVKIKECNSQLALMAHEIFDLLFFKHQSQFSEASTQIMVCGGELALEPFAFFFADDGGTE